MDGLKVFLTKRMLAGVLVAVVVLLTANVLFNKFGSSPTAVIEEQTSSVAMLPPTEQSPASSPIPPEVMTPEAPPEAVPEEAAPKAEEEKAPAEPPAATKTGTVPGIAFVDALIAPLSHELHNRFYGWRPNDIVNFTDNVNSLQRGVLEVTRRAVRILTERISRTGTTIAFNKNLENAMNGFMIKADTYWFPSPETKYQEALDELTAFKEELSEGKESFLTRADNLIPLLQVFEDLLGSCEENLVKKTEKDGSAVGFFASDDYFFYARGVARAMGTILSAVREDFETTIEARRGIEVLDSAIDALKRAEEIDPFIILNSDPDSLFANHRANMAAPISYAKFYVEVLITTLGT